MGSLNQPLEEVVGEPIFGGLDISLNSNQSSDDEGSAPLSGHSVSIVDKFHSLHVSTMIG